MIVKDLYGESYKWRIKDRRNIYDDSTKSKYHLLARQTLKEVFPTVQIIEEVPFFVKNNVSQLYFDFYIPLYRTAIEVQGEQHYSYKFHFHKHTLGFVNQQKRDRYKKDWCELNKITLILLPYNETKTWHERLKNEY